MSEEALHHQLAVRENVPGEIGGGRGDVGEGASKALRERRLAEGFTELAEVAEARREICMSMALAKAVYRRTELGLTQAELAERAGLTQAKVSRIEGSGTVPTLPLLAKLAKALDATLNIALDGGDTRVTFTAHRQDAPEPLRTRPGRWPDRAFR